MLKVCLIILSCYSESFDSNKKPLACLVNTSQIIGVQPYEYGQNRYMVHMRGKYIRYMTVVESPTKIKELADKCYKEF